MIPQSADTDDDAERVQIRILRAMPVWKRLAQVDALYEAATAMTLVGLRRQHPGAGEPALRAMLVERLRAALEHTGNSVSVTPDASVEPSA